MTEKADFRAKYASDWSGFVRNNMTQNGTSGKDVSSKQSVFIDALMTGSTALVAAQTAGISSRTAVRWKQDQAVQQELLLRRKQQFNEALDDFRDGLPEAMQFVREVIQDTECSPWLRLRAAEFWITHALEIHGMQELAARIAMLEERLSL